MRSNDDNDDDENGALRRDNSRVDGRGGRLRAETRLSGDADESRYISPFHSAEPVHFSTTYGFNAVDGDGGGMGRGRHYRNDMAGGRQARGVREEGGGREEEKEEGQRMMGAPVPLLLLHPALLGAVTALLRAEVARCPCFSRVSALAVRFVIGVSIYFSKKSREKRKERPPGREGRGGS